MTAMRENAADLPAFIRADFEFHLAIADAGHNELLAQFYHLTRTLFKEVSYELISLPAVQEESIAIQAAVLKAIEARDPRKPGRRPRRTCSTSIGCWSSSLTILHLDRHCEERLNPDPRKTADHSDEAISLAGARDCFADESLNRMVTR